MAMLTATALPSPPVEEETGGSATAEPQSGLPRVKLDDQLFVDDRRDFLAGRDAFDFTLESVLVEQEPIGNGRAICVAARPRVPSWRETALLRTSITSPTFVLKLAMLTRLAIHVDVAVIDHLARGAAGIAETEAENDVVQARLEELQHGLAGDTPRLLSAIS